MTNRNSINDLINSEYIIINANYGGFKIKSEFLALLIKKYGHDTPEGSTIFHETEPYNDDYQRLIFNDFVDDYKLVYKKYLYDPKYISKSPRYILDTKTNIYYSINEYCEELRNKKFLIDFMFEYAEDKINDINIFYEHVIKYWKCSYGEKKESIGINISDSNPEISNYFTQDNLIADFDDIRIYKYNDKYYLYDHTQIYELTLNQENWKDDKYINFISYIVTLDVNTDLCLCKIQKGFIYTIHEYDGFESIHFKYDYHDIILQLSTKLINNNISAEESDSDIIKKLLSGLTLSEFRELEYNANSKTH